LEAIVDGTYAVTDLEADVPEGADQPFQVLLLFGARLARQKNQQVDVRARVKLAPPIAAGRHQRGIGGHAGVLPEQFHRAVDELRVPSQQGARAGPIEIRFAQRGALSDQLAFTGQWPAAADCPPSASAHRDPTASPARCAPIAPTGCGPW